MSGAEKHLRTPGRKQFEEICERHRFTWLVIRSEVETRDDVALLHSQESDVSSGERCFVLP